jgi:hypothetical protein
MLTSVKIRVIRGVILKLDATLVPTFSLSPLAEVSSYHLASVMKADLRVW